ncbi:hypothetical protein AMK59_4882 [Oryctes borbonicus]|uniref:Methuselah N-terminal domain-containing protein n=1 Tax=Oryctes borbonicus TaxID=1629725 RepID=A0A0T6B7V8_9SCAR|nr:hypothetical protein AMK59_4882 [Oryctes borbonicus]
MKSYVRSVLVNFCVLLVVYQGWSCPCASDQALDITSGVRNSDGSILFEKKRYDSKDYFIYKNKTYGCVCNVKTCVPKCCPEDHIFVNRTCEPYGNFEFEIEPVQEINFILRKKIYTVFMKMEMLNYRLSILLMSKVIASKLTKIRST